MRLLRYLIDCFQRRHTPRAWVVAGTIELDTEHGRAPVKGGITLTVTEATRKP
jgi:hypothetical protein